MDLSLFIQAVWPIVLCFGGLMLYQIGHKNGENQIKREVKNYIENHLPAGVKKDPTGPGFYWDIGENLKYNDVIVTMMYIGALGNKYKEIASKNIAADENYDGAPLISRIYKEIAFFDRLHEDDFPDLDDTETERIAILQFASECIAFSGKTASGQKPRHINFYSQFRHYIDNNMI
ncbi:MAG: hypothetical protein H9535_18585 [Ignavibacteria bacterium]|nr:hypothetical protein [Ignavibacteria bacterium]